MSKGKHLKKDSLNEIISLRASLNKGLSDKFNFPYIIKAKIPKVSLSKNIKYH